MSMTHAEPSPPSLRTPAFIFIFFTVLIDMLSLGIIIPVLPKLIQMFMGGSWDKAAFMTGVFMSVFALVQFIASPVLGALSDTLGRRPVILASNFGLGMDYLIMALAPAMWVLFVGRLFSGLFSATVATAQAYIADITEPEKRAGRFGILGAAFGLGFTLGPAIGGLLSHYDLRWPFLAAAAMSLINFLYGYFILPESLPRERRVPFALRTATPLSPVVFFAANPQLRRLGLIGFLNQLAHHVLPSCAVLYMGYRYQWEQNQVGLMLALTGIASMIVQGGLVRPLVARIGEKKALVIGLVMGCAGFATYGLAETGGTFLLGVPLLALWGFASPSNNAMLSRLVSPEEQGRLQGANASLIGLAGLAGPWSFASAFSYAIDPAHHLNLPGVPFFAAALLMVIALVVGLGVKQPQKAEGGQRDTEARQPVEKAV